MAKKHRATGSRHKADLNPGAEETQAQPYRFRLSNPELQKARNTVRRVRGAVARLKAIGPSTPEALITFARSVFRAVGE